jgi:ABC-type nitrate/sulfonate/bicarbonate transport system permease component
VTAGAAPTGLSVPGSATLNALGAAGARGGRLLRPLGSAVAAVAVVLALWLGFLSFFDISPLVAKSPADVWNYLVGSADAGAHRSLVGSGLGRTLADAGAGFAVGLVLAVVVALVFVLSSGVERSMLPIAVVLRSVPLVAMTPVLTLVFGRGLLGTTVISGMVVFFPALVTIAFGLRSTSKQASDLCRAFGASSGQVARKVMLPSALPALFASARIGVPSALIGAMLAEWLATGKGLGYAMLQDISTFEYDHLWSAVVVLTLVSVVLYYAVAALEAVVLARFGPAPTRR